MVDLPEMPGGAANILTGIMCGSCKMAVVMTRRGGFRSLKCRCSTGIKVPDTWRLA